MMTVAEEANRYVLTVACGSARGQVAALSGFLDERSCYISEFAQFDDATTRRFFARCLFRGHAIERTWIHPKQQALGPAAEIPPRGEGTGAVPTNLQFVWDGADPSKNKGLEFARPGRFTWDSPRRPLA
jgi:hypothetical protein